MAPNDESNGRKTAKGAEPWWRRWRCRPGSAGCVPILAKDHPQDQKLIEIRSKQEAPDTYIDRCGHPSDAALNLKVTAISGCSAFEPAQA